MFLVELNSVGKTFTHPSGKDVQALANVTLNILHGEFISISGPSGSGKSTLLNLIAGLDRPTSGTVNFEGQLLNTLSTSQLAELRLRKIGFVFQAFNLIPVLSAVENVAFILELQNIPAIECIQRASTILDDVGLSEHAHRRPALLSGGQQQRVAVARALVTNPLLVLADEPTANLDTATTYQLLDIMEKMNKTRGITFIFSTHDPRVLERAERKIKLNDGAISEDITT